MMRRREPVTVHRASEPEYNEAGELISEGGEQEIMTLAWAVRFSSSLEFSNGRQNLVVRGVALFPPGADVRETDEIEAYTGADVIRSRVVGLFPVRCPRRNATKHLHVDLEAISGTQHEAVVPEPVPSEEL